MSILEDSSVVIEFLRRREQHEGVAEVLHISSDGQCITQFQSLGSRTLDILCGFPLDADASRVLELLRQQQSSGTPGVKSQSFALEKLPASFAAKYKFASLFVSLVRSRTPRVTLFAERAKCVLMESEGFEAHFAGAASANACGVRALLSPDEPSLVKLVLVSGEQTTSQSAGTGTTSYSVFVGSDSALAPAASTPPSKLPEHLRTAVQLTREHYETCLTISRQMLELESQLVPSNQQHSLFPITLGRYEYEYIPLQYMELRIHMRGLHTSRSHVVGDALTCSLLQCYRRPATSSASQPPVDSKAGAPATPRSKAGAPPLASTAAATGNVPEESRKQSAPSAPAVHKLLRSQPVAISIPVANASSQASSKVVVRCVALPDIGVESALQVCT